MLFEIWQEDFGGFVHVARAHVLTYPTFDWCKPLSWWVSMYVPNLTTIGPVVAEIGRSIDLIDLTYMHPKSTELLNWSKEQPAVDQFSSIERRLTLRFDALPLSY